MYPITFKKERAAYFFSRLITGQSLVHDSGCPGWTVDEMLQVAGACLLAAAVQGPIQHPSMDQLQRWKDKHPEHREAEVETMVHDLHAVLEFMAQLTQMAYDGDYDRHYESVVRCGIQAVDTRVETSVVPREGFKGRQVA